VLQEDARVAGEEGDRAARQHPHRHHVELRQRHEQPQVAAHARQQPVLDFAHQELASQIAQKVEEQPPKPKREADL